MNTKTNITHKYSYLMVNVKHKTQTITQITKRYFSYQLFVIGAVMTKACGGGDTINVGTPINIDNGIDVIAEYNDQNPVGTPLTPLELTNKLGVDDTYIIDYDQVEGNVELQVLGGVSGASGYDTILVQGYTGTGFTPKIIGGSVIRIEPAGEANIEITFSNFDIFERFVFDTNNNYYIDGNDFVWLVNSQEIVNDIKGTDVTDYIYGIGKSGIINGGAGDDYIYLQLLSVSGDIGGDTIYGGDGNDNIQTKSPGGNYIVYGGKGDDTLEAGGSNHKIVYNKGDGNDTITAGDGVDVLILVGFDPTIDILSLVRTGTTGDDLTLNFNDGGSIILENSINLDAAGVDKIVFDTDSNGEDDTDITWEDHQFADFIDGA